MAGVHASDSSWCSAAKTDMKALLSHTRCNDKYSHVVDSINNRHFLIVRRSHILLCATCELIVQLM